MSDKRDNSGSLNRNEEKTDEHPNWPDYNGKCVVNGVPYWISGWAKETDGRKWMSLAFKENDKVEKPTAPPASDKNDDLPF